MKEIGRGMGLWGMNYVYYAYKLLDMAAMGLLIYYNW